MTVTLRESGFNNNPIEGDKEGDGAEGWNEGDGCIRIQFRGEMQYKQKERIQIINFLSSIQILAISFLVRVELVSISSRSSRWS